MNKQISNIVVHCSESAFGCANLIRKWHLEKGWKDIGYHYVILNGCPYSSMQQGVVNPYIAAIDGSIELGRYLDGDAFISDNERGSHALGYNATSVGICLIGQRMTGQFQHPNADGFTIKQMKSLLSLVAELCERFNLPVAEVIGHYETGSGKAQGKTCPNFDMSWFRESMLRPWLEHKESTGTGIRGKAPEIVYDPAHDCKDHCSMCRAFEGRFFSAMNVRPEVWKFALAMERKLKKNDHKGGWGKCDLGWLHERLEQEAHELYLAMRGNLEMVEEEAADVANFAMMIADNATRPSPSEGSAGGEGGG